LKQAANFERALQLHREGLLAPARAAYEEVLRLQPKHADALHFLGVIAAQTNDPARAVELITAAVEVDPYDAAMHVNMGNAFRTLNQPNAALASFSRAIAIKPDFAEAHNCRGIVLCELGRQQAALVEYDKALSIKPGSAEVWSNKGDLLRELGRLDEALACCDTAIGLKEDFADAHCNRGLVLRGMKRWDAALNSLERSIAIVPDRASFHYNRGLILKDIRRWDEALASYDRALGLRNGYAEVHRSRGILLMEIDRFSEALACINEAISIDPHFALAYSSRGAVLHRLNRFDEALADHDRALKLNESLAEAHSNRGATLRELNLMELALASYDRAITLNASFSEAYSNRGTVLLALGKVDAAVGSFNKAIELEPDSAAPHLNRAMAWLSVGDYSNGWREYEWRWKDLDAATRGKRGRRNFSQPLWLGETSLAGKTILIHSEQGLGDTIQFCRYVKLVAELAARVIFEVQAPLAGLFKNLPGVAQVIVFGEELPPFDCHCPTLSLPLAFKTTLQTIPQVPYLRADRDKVCVWKEKLGQKLKLRVGLVWSGGFRQDQPETWTVNERRNIPLAKLAPLSDPDLEFFSLQKGGPAESEAKDPPSNRWAVPHLKDHTSLLHDFSDTAALVENLDLVISVDTSTAHLAGALARPVWLLNRYDSCWRWLRGRTDSPWYPTMRIYQQKSPGDWEGVVATVRRDLMQFLGRGS
jgi:tetratricopeptide (TPR) repeat protein